MKLCNKIGYASRDDALMNRIVMIRKKGKFKKIWLHPYVCPDWGMIHNTIYKSNNKKL